MNTIDRSVFSPLCVRRHLLCGLIYSASLSEVQDGVISSRCSECSSVEALGPKLCALITHLMSHWESHWICWCLPPFLSLSLSLLARLHSHTLTVFTPFHSDIYAPSLISSLARALTTAVVLHQSLYLLSRSLSPWFTCSVALFGPSDFILTKPPT